MPEAIRIVNARVHNLKNVSLDIPRDRIVVFTGVSGSGKSSLVFDTLHTEAQRQLIETFSSFARRRLPKLSRPDVDAIHHLSTSIVIDQKPMGRTLRSTVGTATEVYTYMRMLYSRCGDTPGLASFHFSFNHPEGMCQACRGLGHRIVADTTLLLDRSKTLREGAITHPDYKVGGWNWRELVGVDLFPNDVPVGEFPPDQIERLLHADAIPIVKPHGAGTYAKTWTGVARRIEKGYVANADDELSGTRRDAYQRYLSTGPCTECGGHRLNERARAARVAGVGIADTVGWELRDLDRWLAGVPGDVAAPLVRKMRGILGHLIGIGVGYLSLARSVATLSGGESQRVKMARQLDCDLTGLIYVLDEPSIGLHARDLAPLLDMLRRLRDAGNSVLVVEHDPEVIRAGDFVVDIGPGAGLAGGHVCFAGSQEDFRHSEAKTAVMMRAAASASRPARRAWSRAWPIRDARARNLQALDVDIPQQVFVCITGVAGSGKSTLVHEVFLGQCPGAVVVDQSPVGRSSRANPATYLGVFDDIRRLFSRETGAPASLFSFNSDGACPTCRGQGSIAVEMNFLDDVRIECGDCRGQRFRDDVLALRWKGLNIHDVLCLTAEDAAGRFRTGRLRGPLAVLCDVGLGYLTLGQPLSTLSGGESQRLKLALELGKTGRTYVLDEPTTGLHLADTDRLMAIVDRLVDAGNSVVVIEHNLDVIGRADWVIDLGPEGGSRGGRLMAAGTPEQVAASGRGHTAQYLAARFA